ncbi:MAG TPA: DUF5329 family protein [Phycisphaerae bacterium]|nr:DUF5329 family protein [Phycisphaerae bacterium]
MTASIGRSNAKLWTIVAIVAAGDGLIWIEWTDRSLLVERPSAPMSPAPAQRLTKDAAGDLGGNIRPGTSQPASDEDRIEQLLRFVEHSDVVFIRNGSEYDGAEAAAHLRDKLRAAGLQHPTVDQFIENIASRSSAVGQPYQVRLTDGRTVDAGPWLRMQCETTSVD